MSEVTVGAFNETLTRRDFDRLRAQVAQHNRTQPETLQPVPREDFPPSFVDLSRKTACPPLAAWRSRRYVVILYSEGMHRRLSVNRTTFKDDGRFDDGLTWDELQEIKRQVGFGDLWAVEVYPPDAEIVNVSNIRHLWLLPQAPIFAWKDNLRGEPASKPAGDGTTPAT